MTTYALPYAALSLMRALVCALILAMTFMFAYSPERLLGQAFLVVLIIDGFRPLLAKLDAAVVRTLSGLAYFVPRVAMVVAIAAWFVYRAPEMMAKATSQSGWAFALHLGFNVTIALIFALAALVTLLGIVYCVWADVFGPTSPRELTP